MNPHFPSALAALASLLMLPAPARAAAEDTQVWLFLNGVVPMAEDVTATLELSPRLREGADQVLARGSVDWQVAQGVQLGGGASWVEQAGGHEFRPHQQLQFSHGPLQLRSRVEERFFAGADRAQIRLRQRVQLTVPLAQGLNGVANGELLYIARAESRTGSVRVDSWRATAGANYRLSPRAEIGLAYLAIYSPRAGARDRLSHVPQIRLTLR
ncbi:DUF2490 domain-containing protein [Alteraurantiacibacter buctensis]|uniref:DUF2490 domain-containing protein n=1 Tax=Alteraurantiacibacter buctensis TaxID=1503981 RepID=A0A844YW75_9SPHN|nr:DUF2490 domain-containing protein [Alteraurantiacibacter buctensis]MXO72585.1 DUF2490 domain-containing protein [Alteraurantiacibacter buctensis]